MCLVFSRLSAPNSVSSLFYLQIPPCHHKKVRRHSISHPWVPMHFQMDAVWVCFFLCVSVWLLGFLLMRWKTQLNKHFTALFVLIWNCVTRCFCYRTIRLITKSITHTHWHLDLIIPLSRHDRQPTWCAYAPLSVCLMLRLITVLFRLLHTLMSMLMWGWRRWLFCIVNIQGGDSGGGDVW